MAFTTLDPTLTRTTPRPARRRPRRNRRLREVRYEYSPASPRPRRARASLLVSTYQAGKVVAVGVAEGELTLSYHNFERAMGLAVKPDGSPSAPAPRSGSSAAPPTSRPASSRPAGTTPASCRAPPTSPARSGPRAGLGRRRAVAGQHGLLLPVHARRRHSFVPRWRPPFVTALAAEDRCHLNGLAMADGAPKYVTALAETDTPQGWRPNKATSGCLIDVASGQTVARGFAMPHSPRVHGGRVWMLDSGAGQLVLVDPASGQAETVAELPGYTRGLALHDRFAFVGLSKIRETSTFGGMPIAERRPELKCGVGVVDLRHRPAGRPTWSS